MKKLSLTLMSVLTIFILSQPAQALIELRAGYGLLTSDPDDINSVEIKALDGFHGDLLVSLPVMPLGFGLRYESLGMKNSASVSGSNVEIDLSYERISLVLNKRFIDTLIYFGAIGTIGISEKVESDSSSTGTTEFDDGMTFTVGAEAGAGLGLFSVGAELGYQLGELESDGGSKFKTDGVYLKAHVGVGF